jgi:hypothetical protein
MSKVRDISNLSNVIRTDASGNVTFVSGSTTLASFNTTGPSTITANQYISSSTQATGFTATSSLYTDGGLRVGKDAYVSGTLYLNNVTVYGTQSIQYITSSQLNISTNLITVNTATPSVRFGGIAVQDSGSVSGLTGSLLWDSQTNNWIYNNPSGSGNYDSAMVMMGPQNSSGLGNEVGITINSIPKGAGGHHMTSSAMFESGSNVGIGTNNPLSRLSVGGNGYADRALTAIASGSDFGMTLQQNSTGGGLQIYANVSSWGNIPMQIQTNSGYQFIVTTAGNVGIGTASPSTLLQINTTARTSGTDVNILTLSDTVTGVQTSGYGVRILATSNNGQAKSAIAFEADGGTNNDTAISFYTQTSAASLDRRMIINKNGNVGIGTSSPTAKLDVNGEIRMTGSTLFRGMSSNTLQLCGGTSSSNVLIDGSVEVISMTTNGAERMRITSGGKGLFGTSTPSAGSNGFGTTSFHVNNEVVSMGSLAGFFWENRSGGVTTNSNWYGWYTTSGTIYLYNGAGNIASINGSNGTYTALSDINKKKDFEKSTIGLNAILNLKPTLYRMKSEDETTEKHLGFIAQEVKDYIPQAYVETIAEGKDGGVHIGLNYQAITTTLVKAIQELKAENDTLKEILQRNNIQ